MELTEKGYLSQLLLPQVSIPDDRSSHRAAVHDAHLMDHIYSQTSAVLSHPNSDRRNPYHFLLFLGKYLFLSEDHVLGQPC